MYEYESSLFLKLINEFISQLTCLAILRALIRYISDASM
jgi:hypothetical protein